MTSCDTMHVTSLTWLGAVGGGGEGRGDERLRSTGAWGNEGMVQELVSRESTLLIRIYTSDVEMIYLRQSLPGIVSYQYSRSLHKALGPNLWYATTDYGTMNIIP